MKLPKITFAGVINSLLNLLLVVGLAYAVCEKPPGWSASWLAQEQRP